MSDRLYLHGDTEHAGLILELSNDLQDKVYLAEFDSEGRILALNPECQVNQHNFAQAPTRFNGQAFHVPFERLSSAVIASPNAFGYTVPYSGSAVSWLTFYSSAWATSGMTRFNNGDPIS